MEWSDLPANTNLLRNVNNVLEFGKHKGETIHEVIRTDPEWLHWALQNIPTFKLNRNALLLLPPSNPKYRDYNDLGWGDFNT